jgi:hypothetical protein
MESKKPKRRRIKRETRLAKLERLIHEKKQQLNKSELMNFEFTFRMKHADLFINA